MVNCHYMAQCSVDVWDSVAKDNMALQTRPRKLVNYGSQSALGAGRKLPVANRRGSEQGYKTPTKIENKEQ